MAGGLPPPPTRGESGDFIWIDWYNKLNNLLNTGGIVAWTQIDFSGSSLADLQVRNHEQLNSIQGGTAGEHYHLTLAQWTAFTAGTVTSVNGQTGAVITNATISQAADPTTVQLVSGRWNIYKNTTSGLVKLWANDGGTLKSVTLI